MWTTTFLLRKMDNLVHGSIDPIGTWVDRKRNTMEIYEQGEEVRNVRPESPNDSRCQGRGEKIIEGFFVPGC
jgi:hypothetical protein